jgi:hypothetical protein
MIALQVLAVFVALFMLDFVWARYTLALTSARRIASANYAAILICLSGVAAVLYTREPWLILPAMAGAWAGTWSALMDRRNSPTLRKPNDSAPTT